MNRAVIWSEMEGDAAVSGEVSKTGIGSAATRASGVWPDGSWKAIAGGTNQILRTRIVRYLGNES